MLDVNLSQNDIFLGLSFEQESRLASITHRSHVARGRWIFEAGTPANYVYLLQSGLVALYVAIDSGNMKPYLLLGPSEVLGLEGLFPPGYHWQGAMALAESSMLLMKATDLQALLDDSAELKALVKANLASYIRNRYTRALRLLISGECVLSDTFLCPALLSTNVTGWVNTSSGIMLAECQRKFPCPIVEGSVCPLANKPEHTPVLLGSALLNTSQAARDSVNPRVRTPDFGQKTIK